jgi:RNA recognition motif-containing protein
MSEHSVFVGGLSFNVTEAHLRDIFGSCGTVTKTSIAHNKFGQRVEWGIVDFDSAEEAQAAIAFLNEGYIDGVELTVRLADPTSDILEPT